MSYSLSDQRKQTMLQRLGDAVELIDNHAFLPFYRSIQIKLERDGKLAEWANMIEVAKTKDQPSRYFAKLCQMVKQGTYKFVEKVKEVVGATTLWLDDKLVSFGFGKYHKFWRRKAQEFINVNGQAGLIELLEYAEKKKVNQKYMAKALMNCKPPRQYYTQNVLGGAK